MILRLFIITRSRKTGDCHIVILLGLSNWSSSDLACLRCSDLPNLSDWVELFRKSIPTYKKLAAKDPSAKDRQAAEVRYAASLLSSNSALACS